MSQHEDKVKLIEKGNYSHHIVMKKIGFNTTNKNQCCNVTSNESMSHCDKQKNQHFNTMNQNQHYNDDDYYYYY